MKSSVQSQACEYLNSIYLAISERTEKLVIENKTIRVDENCGLFLVLGDREVDAARTELPDLLKRLFRYHTVNNKFITH
jgi:Hydrolytic ATP binding site of dynein motor region